MKIFLKINAGIFLFIIICLAAFVIIKTIDVNKGKVLAEQEYKNTQCNAFDNFGSVKNLSISPIIDWGRWIFSISSVPMRLHGEV